MISHKRIKRSKLREIAERTQAGETVGMTVRQLLRLFGTRRRGYRVEWFIDKELQKFGLDTKPSFKMPSEYDAMVWFVVRPTEEQIEAALDEFEKTTRGRDWSPESAGSDLRGRGAEALEALGTREPDQVASGRPVMAGQAARPTWIPAAALLAGGWSEDGDGADGSRASDRPIARRTTTSPKSRCCLATSGLSSRTLAATPRADHDADAGKGVARGVRVRHHLTPPRVRWSHAAGLVLFATTGIPVQPVWFALL